MIRHFRPCLTALACLLLAVIHPSLCFPDQEPLVDPSARLARRRTPVVDVFEACKQAVVNISSTQIVQLRSPTGFDRLFEEFFDFPGPGVGPGANPFTRSYKLTSVGSGFVIHPAGYIVTNAHVVARTAERKAIFADQRSFDAQIIAIDHEHDLAVLKIDPPQPLIPLKLGRSSDLMVGETVIAIGNPLGYQHTVTAGVVSALNRTLQLDNNTSFHDLIQTDASINPGNSGGPLLNILGELIGINTAIRGDAQNIGFAIPVDQLRNILPDLMDVERRYHFVTGLRISRDDPPRVIAIDAHSPADQAQAHLADIISQVDHQPIESVIDYHIALINRQPGETLALRLLRDNHPIDTTLTLAPRPKPDGAKLLMQKLKIKAQPITPQMADSLGLSGLRGLLVQHVETPPQSGTSSPARRSPIQPGDIIIQIDRYHTDNLDDVGQILDSIKTGQTVRITLLRIAGNVVYRLSTDLRAQ